MSIMIKAESQVSDLVEDGIYPATLTAIKQFDNAFGPRLGFEFTLGGKGAGMVVMRSTAPKLTEKSKLADIVRGLTGEILPKAELYEGIDLEKLIGKQCHVLINQAASRNGCVYSNVEQVFRLGSV